MKRWNSIWLFFFVLLIGCEDNNKIEDIQSEFILAGVDSDKLVTQFFPSDLKIIFGNETAGAYPSTGYSGDLLIDLNSDKSNDIKFHAYYGYGCSMAGCFSPTKACVVSATDNKVIEIFSQPMSLNDTISNKLNWKILGSKKEGEHTIISTMLSSYTPKWTNSDEIVNNVWNGDDLYLAIRIKTGDIYKFGWINLLIEDYYDLKIKEIGFER